MDNRAYFRAVGLSVAALLASTALAGAQTLDLGAVDVAGSGGNNDTAVGSKAAPGTAAAIAPTQSSLYATEPQTIISDRYISDMLPPQSDMSAIVKMAPSVYTTSPNGPGASEAKIQMRGFVDGQYNITIDGVPFGDANDPTHHSTAYLPSGSLSQVIIDRGPGQASTQGYSSFGGSVNLFSRAFSDTAGGHVDTGWGSDNTQNYNLEAQSGLIKETGTKVLFNYDNTMTDGALQYAAAAHKNYMLKIDQPIGESWDMTLMSSVETGMYYGLAQITMAQAAKYGKSYAGLNANPSSADYFGFNHVHKTTDFEIMTLTGDAGLFQVDNKAYTYAYVNKDLEEKDQTTETTTSLYTKAQLAANPALANDVMGLAKENRFRAFGDILTLSRDVDAGIWSGTGRFGAWVEHVNNTRYLIQRDDTLGLAVPTTTYPAAYQYNILSKIDTFQPFVEYEWKPSDRWSLTPGYKHYDFSRDQFGNPNQTAGGKTQTVRTQAINAAYYADLPYFTARYRVLPELSAYFQYAQGIQAPTVNALYVADPQANKMQPQTTTNYQVGAVWKNDRITADADLYFIDFANYAQLNGSGNNAYYSNIGGVDYQGIEGEATGVVGAGFSLYTSGSLNSAKTKGTNLWVANAPDVTLGGGLLYDKDGAFGSFLTKYVGHRYAGSQVAGTDFNRLKPFNSTDLVVGYRFGNVVAHTSDIKISFGITNLFDHHTITDASSMLSGSTPTPASATYYWMSGRSYFGTLSVSF
ncbi:TonB-dependent receptor [Telmatospirillum siberiense]|uniref:TonB-dependent receptor n=1 Tax=Telmatospirillum siberiense TaxID=382514 RepID=A0A2N3Q0W5_9PROT|nr:TonB-dependent receptor [Telmatospirillum siberiense]PKU26221.1 hypothetical protein CWS72_03620 [Telmatospirillum siberiense]